MKRKICAVAFLVTLAAPLAGCGTQDLGYISDDDQRTFGFENMKHLPPLEGTFDFSQAIPCSITPWSETHNNDDREYIQHSRIPVTEVIRKNEHIDTLHSAGISYVIAKSQGVPSIEGKHRFWVSTWGAESDITCQGTVVSTDIVLVEEISSGEDDTGDFNLADSLFEENLFEPLSDIHLSFEKGDPDI